MNLIGHNVNEYGRNPARLLVPHIESIQFANQPSPLLFAFFEVRPHAYFKLKLAQLFCDDRIVYGPSNQADELIQGQH